MSDNRRKDELKEKYRAIFSGGHKRLRGGRDSATSVVVDDDTGTHN